LDGLTSLRILTNHARLITRTILTKHTTASTFYGRWIERLTLTTVSIIGRIITIPAVSGVFDATAVHGVLFFATIHGVFITGHGVLAAVFSAAIAVTAAVVTAASGKDEYAGADTC
jgi:hypothetical protein